MLNTSISFPTTLFSKLRKPTNFPTTFAFFPVRMTTFTTLRAWLTPARLSARSTTCFAKPIIVGRDACRVGIAPQSMTISTAGRYLETTRGIAPYNSLPRDYRVLFEIEGTKVVVYRVRHRKEAYR